jgi:hypothetical protein
VQAQDNRTADGSPKDGAYHGGEQAACGEYLTEAGEGSSPDVDAQRSRCSAARSVLIFGTSGSQHAGAGEAYTDEHSVTSSIRTLETTTMDQVRIERRPPQSQCCRR